MESSSSSSSKFLSSVILPAIRGRSCPICLKSLGEDPRQAAVITACLHAYCAGCIRRWSCLKRRCPLCNAAFDSWFYGISLSSRRFLTEKLPPLTEGKSVIAESEGSSRSRQRRITERSRAELNVDRGRTRPLPWRRRFGRRGCVASHVIAERKIEWRASVYSRGLRAVPSGPLNCVNQSAWRDGSMKEMIRQRIEPWIERELQALLKDPDPSIIVHVASSLYIVSLEEGKSGVHSGELGGECDFLAPLKPFLRDRTIRFWHELRCFAESTLTMETYDSVVKYIRSD